MAEQGRRWSPYTYAFDNPIRFIDPDGMWPWPNNPTTRKIGGFGQAIVYRLQSFGNAVRGHSDNTKVKLHQGKIVNVKVGRFGGELNLGSREMKTLSLSGNLGNGREGMSEGFNLQYGIGEAGIEKFTSESVTKDVGLKMIPGEDIEVAGTETTTVTTHTGTVSILGLGISHQKTETTSTYATANGVPKGGQTTVTRDTEISASKSGVTRIPKELTKSTKFSIGLVYKAELLYENEK